jgi:hypothetical protein
MSKPGGILWLMTTTRRLTTSIPLLMRAAQPMIRPFFFTPLETKWGLNFCGLF